MPYRRRTPRISPARTTTPAAPHAPWRALRWALRANLVLSALAYALGAVLAGWALLSDFNVLAASAAALALVVAILWVCSVAAHLGELGRTLDGPLAVAHLCGLWAWFGVPALALMQWPRTPGGLVVIIALGVVMMLGGALALVAAAARHFPEDSWMQELLEAALNR